MAAAHIHVPGDGRPPRRVICDGKEVPSAFYADTRRGIVRAYREPIKLHRWSKRALSYTVRGSVMVEALPRGA